MYEDILSLSRQFLEIKYSPYKRSFIRTNHLKHRMSLIIGSRGIGKTTTLVQLLLDFVDQDRFDERILYVQCDHFLVGKASLYEIADHFQKMGGKWLVFDEIHKYPEWSKELKSIYDTFPILKIFASGSSALEIHKGSHDLSRRSVVYGMQGMSFREHLELNFGLDLPSYSLEELCSSHEKIADKIMKQVERKIIPEFNRYLNIGYYPYYHDIQDEPAYKVTLEQNVHLTIESDLVAIYPLLTGVSIQKIKKLLIYIANAVPFTPKWTDLLTALGIGDLRTLKAYFSHLEKAGLIRSLSNASKKQGGLDRGSKIYLDNTNLLYAIATLHPEKGTVRETFFLSMAGLKHVVQMSLDGDFLLDQSYLFEVGGKNKNLNQMKSHKNAFLVLDDLEQGVANKIPLWLFGFLY